MPEPLSEVERVDEETRTTGPKEAYAGFRIEAGKSVPLLGSDPKLPCAEGLLVDKPPRRHDQGLGPRREASHLDPQNRVERSLPGLGLAAAPGYPRGVNDRPCTGMRVDATQLRVKEGG